MFSFLITFLVMIIFGTLVVSGWFFSTRGSTELRPDGSTVRKGKILKAWYFFWMQETGKTPVYYSGAQLLQLFQAIRHHLPGRAHVEVYQGTLYFPNDRLKLEAAFSGNDNVPDRLAFHKLPSDIIRQIEQQEGVKVAYKGDGLYAFYKEYPAFLFPEWVRMPLAQCATCHASVGGTLCYVGLLLISPPGLFSWSELPILAGLFFWVAYCFALAVPLTALAKKYN